MSAIVDNDLQFLPTALGDIAKAHIGCQNLLNAA